MFSQVIMVQSLIRKYTLTFTIDMLYGSGENICWICNMWLTCCETGWCQCWTHNSSHHFNHFILFTLRKSTSDDISSVHTIYSQWHIIWCRLQTLMIQTKKCNKCSLNDCFIICSSIRLLAIIGSSGIFLAKRHSPWSDYRTLCCRVKLIRQYWSLLINDF